MTNHKADTELMKTLILTFSLIAIIIIGYILYSESVY